MTEKLRRSARHSITIGFFTPSTDKEYYKKPDISVMSEKTRSVTYCGFCCLDCHGYTGKIADLARFLRKELWGAQFDKFAAAIADMPFGKSFVYYDTIYKLLGTMVEFRSKMGCQRGQSSAQSGNAARKKHLRDAGNAAKQRRVKGWTS